MYVVALRHAELAHQVMKVQSGADTPRLALTGLTAVDDAAEALAQLKRHPDAFLILETDQRSVDELIQELGDEFASFPKLIASQAGGDSTEKRYLLIDEPRQLHLTGLDMQQSVNVLATIARECELKRCQSAQRQLLSEKNLRIGRLTESAHEFVDRLAHEFRAPIGVIRDFSARLREGTAGEINEQQAALLDTILDRNDELGCQVDDLIDISRQHLGILGIHRSEFDLSPIVSKVVAGLERTVSTYDVGLQWHQRHDLPRVFADPERIARALHCILFNGVKFCEPGGQLEVVADVDDDSHTLLLRVIEPASRWDELDNLEEVLEAFENNPVGFDPRTGSLFGPGLGIARDLVRMNLGSLGFERPDSGHPILTMRLPLAEPHALLKHFCDYRVRADRNASEVSLVVIESMDDEDGPTATPIIDDFLQEHQSSLGFMYPVSQSRWVYAVQRDARQIDDQNKRLLLQWDLCRQTSPFPDLPQLRFSYLGCWNFQSNWLDLQHSFDVATQPTASLRNFRPKILLANPNTESVAGLMERLEAFGYQVIPAHDGRQCVEAAVADPPDAIVLNEDFIDSGGQPTVECLRNQMGQHATPIILLSQDLRSQQEAMERGITRLVVPPDDAEGLREALEDSLTAS